MMLFSTFMFVGTDAGMTQDEVPDYKLEVIVKGMSWSSGWGGPVRRSLQLKSVEMDFAKGLFTLSVDGRTAVKTSPVWTTVPSSYVLASMAIRDVPGHVTHNQAEQKFLFKAARSGLEAELEKGEGEKPLAEIHKKIHDGVTAIKASGLLWEANAKGNDGKEITLLILAVSSAGASPSKKR